MLTKAKRGFNEDFYVRGLTEEFKNFCFRFRSEGGFEDITEIETSPREGKVYSSQSSSYRKRRWAEGQTRLVHLADRKLTIEVPKLAGGGWSYVEIANAVVPVVVPAETTSKPLPPFRTEQKISVKFSLGLGLGGLSADHGATCRRSYRSERRMGHQVYAVFTTSHCSSDAKIPLQLDATIITEHDVIAENAQELIWVASVRQTAERDAAGELFQQQPSGKPPNTTRRKRMLPTS